MNRRDKEYGGTSANEYPFRAFRKLSEADANPVGSFPDDKKDEGTYTARIQPEHDLQEHEKP